ncbi:hypothetical protein ACHAPO_011576 [Fusarium lateritium]
MPFDFKAYDQKCQGLTLEELQREWEHYTRLISGAATSTAISGCAIPLTLGVSTIGVAMAAPAIHNARKKREIIERHLNRLNATHQTRKRDVLGSMAVSGTIGVVTLGVGTMGADAVATAGAEHGIQAIVANETAIKIVSHAALDGAGMAVEHAHTDHLKRKDARKAFQKAGVFQAVQDAKAAEAGYSIQPYQSNGQHSVYAAAGPSQQLPLPPPPYSAAVSQPSPHPVYNPIPNGYLQDFKNPLLSQPTPQQNVYLVPNMTGQQTLQHPYDNSQHQYMPTSSAPSPMPPSHSQMFSPPQTPAIQQQPHHHVTYQQQSGNAPYIPSAPQTFDLSAIQQALPMTAAPPTPYSPPLPQYPASSPRQDNSQNYQVKSPQQQFSPQIAGASQAGYFPPPPATPSGYPPAIAISHQPTTPAYTPHHQGQPGYQMPHQSNAYHQPQVQPTVETNRRESILSYQVPITPQPYNPQNYGPISEQEKTNSNPVTYGSNAYVPAPQPNPALMSHQMLPTPLPTGSSVLQYQYDNKGSYFPTQPQMPQGTGHTLIPSHV